MATNLCLHANNKDTYRASYKVDGGPMNGCIVQIIYGLPDLLREVENKYNDVANFEKDIVDGIGILNYVGKPVTKDVLKAYNSDIPPEQFAVTGEWIKGHGWNIKIPTIDFIYDI